MNYTSFINSLNDPVPPENLSPLLKAMWYLKNDQWTKSHDLAQEDNSMLGSWIHALLHKIEGDEWNANYWYRKAKIENPRDSVENEWKKITIQLLRENS